MSDEAIPVPGPAPVDPRTIPRGWAHTGLVALAILVPALALSLPGFAITGSIGFLMTVAGPVYAVFYVPIAIRKWRRAEPAYSVAVSPERDLITSFGTLNQKLTMVLSGILVANLVVFFSAFVMLGDFGPLIPCGMVAVCAGIPIFILNLVWIRRSNAISSESIAVRTRLGAWKLIIANRVLSLIVWCAYPAASIVGIAVNIIQ